MPDGRACIHGTAVAYRESGLLILGPSGSGKSSLAAQIVTLGGALVSDDLVVLSTDGGRLVAAPPDGRVPCLELRGLFPVTPQLVSQIALKAVLRIAPSAARMPPEERFAALGLTVPLWRHPALPDLGAKVILALESDVA